MTDHPYPIDKEEKTLKQSWMNPVLAILLGVVWLIIIVFLIALLSLIFNPTASHYFW
jgi:hypothetical protein